MLVAAVVEEQALGELLLPVEVQVALVVLVHQVQLTLAAAAAAVLHLLGVMAVLAS